MSSSLLTTGHILTGHILAITDHSFQYTLPCLWTQLPASLHQPRLSCDSTFYFHQFCFLCWISALTPFLLLPDNETSQLLSIWVASVIWLHKVVISLRPTFPLLLMADIGQHHHEWCWPASAVNSRCHLVNIGCRWAALTAVRMLLNWYWSGSVAGCFRPFTGKHLYENDDGLFTCIVCNAVLFQSDQKFDSDCGWPSFSDVYTQHTVNFNKDMSSGQ